MWSLRSFPLSDGEDFSEVVGRGPSFFNTAERWQIKTEGSFGVIRAVFLHQRFITVTSKCRHQPGTSLPWLLFLASEEGSRCKITGLRESNWFELELRLLSCEMKRCTRPGDGSEPCGGVPEFTSRRLKLPLCRVLLPPPASRSSHCVSIPPQPQPTPPLPCRKHLASESHCCPGNGEEKL